jgi:hypothetical protein
VIEDGAHDVSYFRFRSDRPRNGPQPVFDCDSLNLTDALVQLQIWRATIDGSENLYVTDADPANSRVVKISPSGAGSVISTGSVTLHSPNGVAN